MRQIRTRLSGSRVVVDVDGRLDAVNGHDLQRAVESAWADGSPHVHLDLSQIYEADADGLAALARCSAHAVTLRHVLTWSRCSPPLLRALRAHEQTTPPRRG